MSVSFVDLLIGRRVANREAQTRKLGVLEGFPAMGLDGLSSSAYGPEAALTVLVVAGVAGLNAITAITLAILGLLAILWFSYWQTVEAYPTNGGAYIVAKENLGINAGLLAAAALMVDYTLNVAVGISAGVAALTSAMPALHAWTLWICLLLLAVITLMNLRGTRESGFAWAIPTYGFILSLAIVLLWGITKTIGAGGQPQPVVAPPQIAHGNETLTLWLVLRAFASGCTAMTGVEVVSNGVSTFRDPRTKNAHATLSFIVIVLSCLLLGIAYLARTYHVAAMDQTKEGYQTIISQIIGAVYGHDWFYYLTLASVLCVLCLSANTSFVGFPRLCHLVAHDGYLPRSFAVPGRRLVYSVGILFLAVGAGGLLTVFGGITDRLIPLFAVGAFLSFTLSQAGMAAHWWHDIKSRHHSHHSPNTRASHAKLIINGGGACATGTALIIILVAKFVDGAWVTVIVIPATLALVHLIHRYYAGLDTQLLQGGHQRLEVADGAAPLVLVPISRWDRIAQKAIQYALRLSNDITAYHVTTLQGPDLEEHEQNLRQEWADFVEKPAHAAGLEPPRLRLVQSQYRSVAAPLLREIEKARNDSSNRLIFVVLPEIVEGHWWEYLLHTHRERRLRARLLRYGGPNLAVVGVPWQLCSSDPEEGIEKEEPAGAS